MVIFLCTMLILAITGIILSVRLQITGLILCAIPGIGLTCCGMLYDMYMLCALSGILTCYAIWGWWDWCKQHDS